jgi:hypothetical protein
MTFRDAGWWFEGNAGFLDHRHMPSAGGRSQPRGAISRKMRASAGTVFARVWLEFMRNPSSLDVTDSPKIVTFFGSPANAAIFLFTHRKAAIWSINW